MTGEDSSYAKECYLFHLLGYLVPEYLRWDAPAVIF